MLREYTDQPTLTALLTAATWVPASPFHLPTDVPGTSIYLTLSLEGRYDLIGVGYLMQVLTLESQLRR